MVDEAPLPYCVQRSDFVVGWFGFENEENVLSSPISARTFLGVLSGHCDGYCTGSRGCAVGLVLSWMVEWVNFFSVAEISLRSGGNLSLWVGWSIRVD